MFSGYAHNFLGRVQCFLKVRTIFLVRLTFSEVHKIFPLRAQLLGRAIILSGYYCYLLGGAHNILGIRSVFLDAHYI
jgi:hypothetical protein